MPSVLLEFGVCRLFCLSCKFWCKNFNTLTGDKNWAKNRIWAAINQISDSNQAVAGEEGGTHYYFQIKKRKKEGNGVGKKIPFSRGTLYGKWVQWRVWYIASISEQNFSPIFFSLSSSQTHTHTHAHTHTHMHTLALSLAQACSHARTHTHSFFLQFILQKKDKHKRHRYYHTTPGPCVIKVCGSKIQHSFDWARQYGLNRFVNNKNFDD